MNTPEHWIPLPDSWRNAASHSARSVLLESTSPSLEQHRSFLFQDPLRCLTAESAEQLPDFFASIETALTEGHYLAGYITYEAGAHLLGLPAHPLPSGQPLARFGVYKKPEVFDHLAATQQIIRPKYSGLAQLELAMMPTVSPAIYTDHIRQIHDLIASGDTYQVNYTIPFRSAFRGDALQAYTRIALEQPCSYSALLRLDAERTVLSFSPELFFATTAEGRITTRPMKGTAPRASALDEDKEAARRLQRDEKNRAEHVMIVDLLRNDLGRICEPGSVRTSGLFDVEAYPTVHQMVSTISGQLRERASWRAIFTSMFPSGSITGAPKRRTMQIIHEIENRPRGIYTGAIGYIAPNGESAFSVAIRTLELQNTFMSMGVGGGIVADSVVTEEWKECLLKASFVHRGSEDLRLIETMLIQGNRARVPRLQLHLKRLQSSASALGFVFDWKSVLGAIEEAADKSTEPMRLRLTLSRSGEIAIRTEPLAAWPTHLHVKIAEERTNPSDPALLHKTTFRHTYDSALKSARSNGYDECIFLNARDEITEGCITNLVLAHGDVVSTPALACGVLPGVFRQRMMDVGLLRETILTLNDLASADAMFLCNSVRGLVPVSSVEVKPGERLSFHKQRSMSLRDSILSRMKSTSL